MNPASARYDVSVICNALVDISFHISESQLAALPLRKGMTSLIDRPTKDALLHQFAHFQTAIDLGGSSLNMLRTLARLGHKVFFIGMVGTDPYASIIQTQLNDQNVLFHLATHSEVGSTGTCLVFITPDGERTMATYLGASRLIGPGDIPWEIFEHTRYWHISAYLWDSPHHTAILKKAREHVKTLPLKISFDVADGFVVEHHAPSLEAFFPSTHLFFANALEARLLNSYWSQGFPPNPPPKETIVILKQGALGARIIHGDSEKLVPAAPISRLIDTTGAGDLFAAGFLHGQLTGASLEHSGTCGALLAADIIQRYSTTPTEQAIESVLLLQESFAGTG